MPEEIPADYTGPATVNMVSVGYKGLDIVKGDVLKTIPMLDVRTIALLRCDTDTHETTAFELDQLYDRIVPGGVVIIDDYGVHPWLQNSGGLLHIRQKDFFAAD